ncbi:MAG TPA: response regulator [Desulfuromonadales bacterium]|nr:response regulator [Desulfuromonadales bacterium]
MKILIVEDDFLSRKLMLTYLSQLGECDVAANGTEAVEAFMMAGNMGKSYDLITLDIMMPDLSGQEVLKQIRYIEEEAGLPGVKIIMTTALKDSPSIMEAFKNQCDGYLPKPIESGKLWEMLRELRLID